MALTKLTVGPDTVRMLELGHPWVIADRYTRLWPKNLRCGDLALLQGEDGTSFGTALLDPADRVVARLLDRQDCRITPDWLLPRLAQAGELRSRHLQLGETDAYRLVNGEGDGLPGLVIDRYGDHLLVQTYTDAWLPHLPLVVKAVQQQFSPQGVWHKGRPRQTREVAELRDDQPFGRLLAGSPPSRPLQVSEHDLRFLVDLQGGLHTGLFIDQRENRRLLMPHCQGAKVLNLFSYTGAFSVAAAVAGAKQVTSVDASSRYMEWSRDNFSVNRLNPKRHRFETGDCFAVLQQLARQREEFDLVLLDPPSFSTTKQSRFATRKGTSDLIASALGVLRPGGLLFACSNHQKSSLEDYLKELRRGALQASTTLQVIAVAGQGGDFPYPVTFPEGAYLKFVVGVKGAR